MPQLFKCESSAPKYNAQRNLCGRTHYVDDDTLRFHKCRIISARSTDNGLLFAIVTSDAVDYENTKRCYRYAVFDLLGTVVSRPTLEQGFSASAVATKRMWEELNRLDAKALTLTAIKEATQRQAQEMRELTVKVKAVQS